MAGTDMAGLPRLAAGGDVSLFFFLGQTASAPSGALFFGPGASKIFAMPGGVDVGEKDLPEGGRFLRTELAERGKRTDQAMISGVIWSSMKAMRSRNCSLRFFNRCSRSRSGAGD